MFYEGVPIDHCTHVPGPFAQPSSERYYNASCTAVMSIAHFKMLNNDFMNKYPYMVPQQAPLIIFDRKSSVYMAKNGKDTKHTSHIARKIHFVRNGEE